MTQHPPTSAPKPVTPAHIFISYRIRPPDSDLAQEFHHALTAAGHEVFMAGESIKLGDNWSSRVDEGLDNCDYFVHSRVQPSCDNYET